MLLALRQRTFDSEFAKALGTLRQSSKLCTDAAAREAIAELLDEFSAAVEVDPRVFGALRLFDSLCDSQTGLTELLSDCRSLHQSMPPRPEYIVDPPGTKRATSHLGLLLDGSTLPPKPDTNAYGHHDYLGMCLCLSGASSLGPSERQAAIGSLSRIYAKISSRWHPVVDAILPNTWREEWANRGVACVLIDTFPDERDRIHPADWHLYRAVRAAVRFVNEEPVSRQEIGDAIENYLNVRGEPIGPQLPPGVFNSPDFSSINWHGETFEFSRTQAAAVGVLWEAWKHGTPVIHDAGILEAIDSDSERLGHVFRGHPAWGTLIVEGSTKGTHRLVDGPVHRTRLKNHVAPKKRR